MTNTTRFADISLKDLLDDFYAAKLDLKAMERLNQLGSTDPRVQERIRGNRKVIAVIEQELRDRGEPVPA